MDSCVRRKDTATQRQSKSSLCAAKPLHPTASLAFYPTCGHEQT
jgi:hypothetical protein